MLHHDSQIALLEFRSGKTYEQLTPKIKSIAHDLWEKAGNPDNSDLFFWFEAESQLLAQIVREEENVN